MLRNRIRCFFPQTVLVRCRSGRVLDIPTHHPVFTPVGCYLEGDSIDPCTVDVTYDSAIALQRGFMLIVDNRVEVVEAVT
jgi:hypothetical protein